MLVLYFPETIWLPPDVMQNIMSWKDEWRALGILQEAFALKPPGLTNTIKNTGNGQMIVDETSYYDEEKAFVGYAIIECEDMTRAIEIAQTHPCVGVDGAVMEVREVWVDLETETREMMA